MGYKEELRIDMNRLDTEWEKQPVLFCEWAEREVEALYERDRLKENLDLKRAELDLRIRKSPGEFGLDKPTENAINNVILQSEEYRRASDEYLTAVKNAKIIGVAREAFDQRKKALEKITDLFLFQYWSEPKEGRVTREIKEDNIKKEHYGKLANSRASIIRRRE